MEDLFLDMFHPKLHLINIYSDRHICINSFEKVLVVSILAFFIDMYKYILALLFFLFLTSKSHAQDYFKTAIPDLGNISDKEHNLEIYALDSAAVAVVLFETGVYTFDAKNGYIQIKKEIRRRVKVFDASKYEGGELSIPLYIGNKSREELVSFDAFVVNGDDKFTFDKEKIYTVDNGEQLRIHRIPLSNIKDGSIIDYEYTVTSPYLLDLGDWTFQNDIPKMYSEITTKIPGNYKYRSALYGGQKLDHQELSKERRCLVIPGFSDAADCQCTQYVMKNIPALEDESFRLSLDNYKSKISFELFEQVNLNGEKTTYSKTWDDVDAQFKKSRTIGGELGLERYFKKNMPEKFIDAGNSLDNAKAIYRYIQNTFTWNGDYRVFSEVDVKKSFENGTGNVAEINLSLVNALVAAGFDAKAVMLSTRDRPLPGTVYPVLTDFNYVQAFVDIDGKEYILDATDKLLPFGMIPFKTLTNEGRVLDFDNGSYWSPLRNTSRNVFYVSTDLKIDDNLEITGIVKEKYVGYLGYLERKGGLDKGSQPTYRNQSDLELDIVSTSNFQDVEKPLDYTLSMKLPLEEIGKSIYFNPLAAFRVDHSNDFVKETRQYPIDFGYSFTEMYLGKIAIPDNYLVESMPENISIASANGKIKFQAAFTNSNGVIQVRVNFDVSDDYFPTDQYTIIKGIWDRYTTILDKTVIKISQKS